MITPAYAQLMARYNHWQNQSLYDAADALTDGERRRDRAAFFRSIHETLGHILWADQIWLSRFGVGQPPAGGIAQSTLRDRDWDQLKAAREAMDTVIRKWAAGLTPQDLEGELIWFSGALGREVTRPRALLVAHVFNHQTHHRGQVHAMLTAAGTKPEDTDLPFMPAFGN